MLKKLAVAATVGVISTAALADETLLESYSARALYRVEFGGAHSEATTHRLAFSQSASSTSLGAPALEYRWQGDQTQFNVGGLPVTINGERVAPRLGAGQTILGMSTGVAATVATVTLITVAAVSANKDDEKKVTSGTE